MILSVPVKPWVKHLLKKQYGKEPIAIRANSDVGSFLMLSLSAKDRFRLTVDDLTEEDAEGIMPDCEEEYEVLSFMLGGRFLKGVIIADTIPLISYALEGYARIFAKGYSLGYRTLLNSELSSAVSFYRLYQFPEKKLKQDRLVKIIQRESKEMKDVLNEYYAPRRLKDKTV
jgi:hypothetical protein